MSRQELADALDAELLNRPLPAAAVRDMERWLSGLGARYRAGIGGHAVEYVPSRWSNVEPWPEQLAVRSHAEAAMLSRAEVVAVARRAAEGGEWSALLVASYVWGQGRTGYGPHRLRAVLAQSAVDDVLAAAAAALKAAGATDAYRVLCDAIPGLGPAFFTKFLYFLDLVQDGPAPRALILDRRVARAVRAHAARVGLDAGLVAAPTLAAWTWSNGAWTSHRYGVYLRWITAAADQLAASGIGWPEASPDLLELALFGGVWAPEAPRRRA
ncbi:hypothetical protein [Streptomyces sp. NPDC058674]|uniref:8-oxoguanine DNA glycosylase OGG fold protein n=1 Tax=Streptomyces sp. NPDC058674 TaxID=3346592 RepID=UPI0036485E96